MYDLLHTYISVPETPSVLHMPKMQQLALADQLLLDLSQQHTKKKTTKY